MADEAEFPSGQFHQASSLWTRLRSLLKSPLEPVHFKDGNVLCTLTTVLRSQVGVFNCKEKGGKAFQEDQVKSSQTSI